jgi:hypothetical protein
MINQAIETEIEVLRAIFGNDFYDLPPVWNQPIFAINVRPSDTSQGHVENLSIKCKRIRKLYIMHLLNFFFYILIFLFSFSSKI